MLIKYITATYRNRPVSHLKLSDTNVINVLEMHLDKLIEPVKLVPFMSNEPFAGELELVVTTVPDFIEKINTAIKRAQSAKNQLRDEVEQIIVDTQFIISTHTGTLVQLRSKHSTSNNSVVNIQYRAETNSYTFVASYIDDFTDRFNIRFAVSDIPKDQLATKIQQLDELFDSTTKRLQLLYNTEED